MIDIKKLNIKEKVELLKQLYKDISSKGIKGDTELAHINEFEKKLLIMHGGSGTINPETGLTQYFGGGGGGQAAQPDTTTQYVREAPGIEERKLGLMDIASSLAAKPLNLPAIQVQGLGGLEQQGLAASGITGVGQPTVGQGIASIQGALGAPTLANQYGAGAVQTAAMDPTSTQFQNYFNPYQSFITDEINRQAQMQQNQIANQAVMGGAFGGGREGVQRAELGGRTLSAIGQAQGTAFQNALNTFQQNQALQAQTGLQAGQMALSGGQLGLQGGAQLGQLGTVQQSMAQGDINQLMAGGGLQRQLGQQALDAARQTTLQQQYEPFQRAEFLKNIYAAGPTSQSAITSTTSPGTNPLAQAAGAGLGAYATYSALNRQPAALQTAFNTQATVR
jgi:hypothetical protein